MFKWFVNCQTLEEAKELYKKLCREYHPDLNENDTTETMKSINNEFEQVFKTLKNKQADTTADSKENRAETTETPAEFMTIINALINCEGVTIDLVGCWIWVTGNTYQYKDVIKGLGFRWSSTKKAWYYHRAKDTCRSRKKQSLDEIKNKYGCETFRGAGRKALATA